MYDLIQTALTASIEAIALVAVIGLPTHYIITSHVREVKSWGTPHTTPAPHVEVEPEVKAEVKAVVAKQPEAQTVATKQPEVVKTRKPRSKKTHLTTQATADVSRSRSYQLHSNDLGTATQGNAPYSGSIGGQVATMASR
jgi:hypothetical protein